MKTKVAHPLTQQNVTLNFQGSPRSVRVAMDLRGVIEKCTRPDGSPITQGEFASLVGLSANTLSRMVNNSMRVDFDSLSKILSATGCTINELLRVEDQ